MFAVLGGRRAVSFLEHTVEGHLVAEATVGHNGLKGVVGVLVHQFYGVGQALLVQVVGQILTTALLGNDAAEGGAVDTHHAAEIIARDAGLGIEPSGIHLFVEAQETLVYGIRIV